jgi:hypothetical protein
MSTSLSLDKDAKGITLLTSLWSGRLPVRSIALKASGLG